jgi:hypothetical protein
MVTTEVVLFSISVVCGCLSTNLELLGGGGGGKKNKKAALVGETMNYAVRHTRFKQFIARMDQ